MGLIALDTGVLVGFTDEHDHHHVVCREAVRRARERSDEVVVPMVVYSEFLVGWVRKNGLEDGRDRCNRFIDLLGTLRPVDRAIASCAAELRALHPQLKLPDALVIATAAAAKASRLVTVDRGWPDGLPVAVEVLGAARPGKVPGTPGH